MYRDEQLQELINEARKEGYELINGRFEKVEETEEEMFPVMEMFFFNNSVYEDFGKYNIFKKTVKIDEEDFEKMISFAKENNCTDFECNYEVEDEFIDEIIDRVINKYDKSSIEFMDVNIGGTITVQLNEYRKYTTEDKCVDLWFTKENDNDDFPRGYISFYLMESSDFEKAENIDLRLEKFMRDNI